MTIPYVWLNDVLVWLAGGTLVGAVAFVAAAIVRGKARRRRPLLGAGCCLSALLLIGAADYVLVFRIQMPSLARSLARENQRAKQEYIAAVSLVKPGDQAPSFRLKSITGSEYVLDELRGKVVLLNFFASSCAPCRKELPHLQELWKEYGGRGDFVLLVIGLEESDQSVRGFVAKHGYSFPAAADPKGLVFSAFAKGAVPRTYLIARDGTIGYAGTGFNEEEAQRLRRELARQLPMKE